MTTYTITGTQIYYDFTYSFVRSVDSNSPSLEIVVPDNISTFSYNYNASPLITANLNINAYSLSLDGAETGPSYSD